MPTWDIDKDYELAGDQLLGMRGFERKHSDRTGADYLNVEWVVIAGDGKGEQFKTVMSLDPSNRKSMASLTAHARAAGVTKGFDTDNDELMYDAFVGKALKATLRTSSRTYNGSTYDDLRIAGYKLAQGEEVNILEQWARRARDEGLCDPAEQYKNGGNTGGGGSTGGSGFNDDDIPF